MQPFTFELGQRVHSRATHHITQDGTTICTREAFEGVITRRFMSSQGPAYNVRDENGRGWHRTEWDLTPIEEQLAA